MQAAELTKRQQEVLVGILLGDASLRSEATLPSRYRLSLLQSEKHKDYLFHLYEVFKNLTTSPPVYAKFSDKRNPNKTYFRWSFNTTQQSCFFSIGQLFYNEEQKKIVPDKQTLKNLLTGRSLAYWFMDDGAQKWKSRTKGVVLCTDSFKLKEVEMLACLLTTKFGLLTSLHKKGKNSRIYISAKSFTTFKELVEEHVVDSMRYKMPTD